MSSHERRAGGTPADRAGGAGAGDARGSDGAAGRDPDNAWRDIHPDDCFAVVRSHAFFGALHYAESTGKSDAYAYAEAIRNRIPECDCDPATIIRYLGSDS